MTESRSTVETLRWRDGRLELIDQRALPSRVSYVSADSAASVADAIRDMVVRGAPAIGCAAAYGVALEALRLRESTPVDFRAGMEIGMATLAASRPTAVNLFWALDRMKHKWVAVDGRPAGEIAQLLLNEANAIHEADIADNKRMGKFGAALIPDGARVMTHCNAGALATAGHGTALGVVRSAIEAGKKVTVIANETRPFLQGARLTVWELAQDGIPVTLIADNAAGFLMSRGLVDAVIVGADRIAANGDVANKIGTYTLAVVADRNHIPFYVAAPTSTIDSRIESGADIPIEERAGDEVRGYRDQQWAPPDVEVRNPVFDITPAKLVTALITEKGLVRAPNARRLKELLKV